MKKFKFLKDTKGFYDTIRKKGTVVALDDRTDEIDNEEISWCVGHGEYEYLKIGVDVEVIQNDNKKYCCECGHEL